MGATRVSVRIRGEREAIELHDLLVDTGATHTSVTGDLAKRIGLRLGGEVRTMLADKRLATRPIGVAELTLDGTTRTVPVVVAEVSKLGLTTLEVFGLAVDPAKRRLVPSPNIDF